MGTLVVSCHLKGTTRASRRLLEDEGNVLSFKERLLRPAVLGLLEVCGQIDQKTDFLGAVMSQR